MKHWRPAFVAVTIGICLILTPEFGFGIGLGTAIGIALAEGW